MSVWLNTPLITNSAGNCKIQLISCTYSITENGKNKIIIFHVPFSIDAGRNLVDQIIDGLVLPAAKQVKLLFHLYEPGR